MPIQDFIQSHTSVITLDNGLRVLVRPAGPDDRDRLREGLTKTSAASRYLRFLRAIEFLTDHEIDYLLNLDYHDHFAWGALAVDQPGEPGLGIARYVRDKNDPESAEAAVMVIDEAQNLGIGTLLIRLLAESAQEHGIRRFTAYVSAENRSVIDGMKETGADLEYEDTHVKVSVDLPFRDELFPGSILRETLRTVATGQQIVDEPAGLENE